MDNLYEFSTDSNTQKGNRLKGHRVKIEESGYNNIYFKVFELNGDFLGTIAKTDLNKYLKKVETIKNRFKGVSY